MILLCLLTLFAETLPMKPQEADFVVPSFKFQSGEELQNMKLHYRTLGERKVEGGRTTNAVLLLHGTTGTGEMFLNPSIANYLFGPGQPLDVTKYFVIIPDGIGRGGSAKPSDGLKAKFPHYGYRDLVEAQHLLVKEGLGVDHLQLVLGTSMGGMHTWLWGEMYPTMMETLMPIASQPVAVKGRNYLWRYLLMEAIKNDPGYEGGNYTKQPQYYQNALPLFRIMTTPVKELDKAGVEQFNQWVEEARKTVDANDYIWAFEAVSDYDPEPHLDKIQAKLFAVNFAGDLLNPVDLGLMEKVMPRVKGGEYVIVPEGTETNGHLTLLEGKVWVPYLKKLIDSVQK